MDKPVIDVDYEVISPVQAKSVRRPAELARRANKPNGWGDEVFYTLEALGWLTLIGIGFYGVHLILVRIFG